MAVFRFSCATVAVQATGAVVDPPGPVTIPTTSTGLRLPHVHSVTVNRSAAMLDITEFCSGNTKINMAGLFEWSMDIEMFQDFADNSTDEILAALFELTESFTVQITGKGPTVATDNPQYWGKAVMSDYGPLGGAVGDAVMVKTTFQCASALYRDATPGQIVGTPPA